MMKITQAPPKVLNSMFNNFSRQTISNRKPNAEYFTTQLCQYEKRYKKLNMMDVFCENVTKLAQALQEKGLDDFAGIIYANLVKLPNVSYKDKEVFAKRALKIAQSQGDDIKALGRIVDLKKIYQASGRKRQVIETLQMEEKQLKDIVGMLEELKLDPKDNFDYSDSIKKYQLRLAMAKVDIAKSYMNSSPEVARVKVLTARDIFEQYGREKEVAFINELLRQLEIKLARGV